MKVSAIKCQLCKDTIYSRSRHDMRSCSCKQLSIDGGRDYLKISWSPMIHLPPDPFQLEVEATSTQLHQDWNHRIDKYGLIRQDEGATV